MPAKQSSITRLTLPTACTVGMGDYTWTYNEFVKDPDKFWDHIARNSTGSPPMIK